MIFRSTVDRRTDVSVARGQARPRPAASVCWLNVWPYLCILVQLMLVVGCANGAFGAGLLNGWTVTGTRPVFKLVTGISTGALIAPFAFLGSAYDATLQEFCTTITTKDIYRERSLFSILFDPSSMVDTTPLQEILARQVDEQVLTAVAQVHRQRPRGASGQRTRLCAGGLPGELG